MNNDIKYLEQLNYFDEFTTYNSLSKDAQFLWYKLIQLNNKCFWKEIMELDNFLVMGKALIKREKHLVEVRNELIDIGLLEYRKGTKGRAAQYHLVPLIKSDSGQIEPDIYSRIFNPVIATLPDENAVETDTKNDVKNDTKSVGENSLECAGTNDALFAGENAGKNDGKNDCNNDDKPPEKAGSLLYIYKDKDKDKDEDNILDISNDISLSSDKQTTSKKQQESIDYNALIDFWNEHRGCMPAIKSINGKRRESVRARIRDYSKTDFMTAILKAEKSDFLNGRVNDFMGNFDWIIKPTNFPKVLEGNYDNREQRASPVKQTKPKPQKTSVFMRTALGLSEQENNNDPQRNSQNTGYGTGDISTFLLDDGRRDTGTDDWAMAGDLPGLPI